VSSDNKYSAKYLDGWGDDLEKGLKPAGSKKSLKSLFTKFSQKDREYFQDQWRKRYLGFAEALLDEEEMPQALNDGYLKKIEGI